MRQLDEEIPKAFLCCYITILPLGRQQVLSWCLQPSNPNGCAFNYFLGPEAHYSVLGKVLGHYSIFTQTRGVNHNKLCLIFAPCGNDLEFRNAPGSDICFCRKEPSVVFIWQEKMRGVRKPRSLLDRSCVVIERVVEDRARGGCWYVQHPGGKVGRERSWKANTRGVWGRLTNAGLLFSCIWSAQLPALELTPKSPLEKNHAILTLVMGQGSVSRPPVN